MEINLAAEVGRISKQQVDLCYHCHKCTSGCPIVDAMEYGPDLVLKMVSLNQQEEIFRSRDIWLCAGCYTCATRCPNEIDIAAVMDALRQLAVAERYPAGVPDALLFHRLFLGVVKRLGRSHEAAMLGLFKMLAQVPITNDLVAGARLFMRGKVPLLPKRTRAAPEVRRIFNEVNR